MLEPDFQAPPPVILVVEDEKILSLISKCALTQVANRRTFNKRFQEEWN